MRDNSHSPELTPEEFLDGAIERAPKHRYDLEAASLEGSGTLNVWNQAGQTVEIDVANRDAVIALLLQGRVSIAHLNALMEAAGDNPVMTAVAKGSLSEIFDLLIKYAPPVGAGMPLRVVRGDKGPPAVMWTVNAELEITSCTGPGMAYLREADRQQLTGGRPKLWDIFGTSPEDETIQAHLKALAGEGGKLQVQRAGVCWDVHLMPVQEGPDSVSGVVGYATAHAENADLQPTPDYTFVMTTPDGVIVGERGSLTRMLGLPEVRLAGKSVVEVVQHHLLRAVVDPEEFVRRIAEFMSSPDEVGYQSVDARGRTFFTRMIPVKDELGAVVSRLFLIKLLSVESGAERKMA